MTLYCSVLFLKPGTIALATVYKNKLLAVQKALICFLVFLVQRNQSKK